MPYYRYHHLGTANTWLTFLLLPPAILSVIGLVHGGGILEQMQQFAPQRIGASLPPDYREQLRIDGWLRFSQISLTLFALTFFCTVWLYLAQRNLLALWQTAERSIARSLRLFATLMVGILFALRMFQRLWRESQPDAATWQELMRDNAGGERSQADEPRAEQWLVPLWWLDLIAANVCKVAAVYQFSHARTVAEMVGGYHLMLAAYALYLPLYFLTWRLAWRVDFFQQQALVTSRVLLPPAGGPSLRARG